MPANLNALIRYKTIDRCLSNGHRQWTIQDLIDACSDTLGEYRGIYKTVSERTIRDDLRVMRSDMLGFNAPIEFGEGNYFYSDTTYSIFNVRVSDDRLLSRILELLIDIRTEISHPELEKMIDRLTGLIPFKTEGAAELKDDMASKVEFHKGKPVDKELSEEELVEDEPVGEGPLDEDLAIPEAPPALQAPEERKFSRRRGVFPSFFLRSGRRKIGAMPPGAEEATGHIEPADPGFLWSGILQIIDLPVS